MPASEEERGDENIDVVNRVLGALARGDGATVAGCFHDDAIWQNTGEFPGPLTCVGPEAIVRFWTALAEPFDDSRRKMEIERVLARGDTVVAGLRSHATGAASGAPLDVRWAAVFRLHAGKISRVDVHGDWGKALDAAGMSG